MALTKDKIKADSKLATLTDEQVAALETLSKNDEDSTIGTRIGELHGQYDTDILQASGIQKAQGEKSYEYAKRVIADLKSKATPAAEIQGKLTAAETKVRELEEQIKKGSTDTTLKQKLTDSENLVKDLQTQLQKEKEEAAKKLQDKETEMQRAQFINQMDAAASALTYKPDTALPVPVRQAFIETKKSGILAAYVPDIIDDGKGGKIQVLRSKSDNQIYRNPSNALNPFTIAEVMQLELKDILDASKTGGGTEPPSGGGQPTPVSLGDAKSQVQADEAIRSALMEKGLARGTEEFNTEFQKIRTEHQVEKLPVK